MSEYLDALGRAMKNLSEDDRVVFLGQSVSFGGQRGATTFDGIPIERRVEMPIAEDFTVGFSIGLALSGFVPVVFIPRWDFLLLAANQIVNHLDKVAQLGGFEAKVIIRTAAGASAPLDPGPQHVGNHTRAFRLMLDRVAVLEIFAAKYVEEEYRRALGMPGPAIVVEHMEKY